MRVLKKPLLRVYEFQADASAIAKALRIEDAAVIKEFRDGRVVSRFSEHWASKVYGYKREENSNAPFSDGFVGNALGVKVSVKSLTDGGVKFQQSRDQGAGRSCDENKLREAVRRVDRHLVVDCSEFPVLRMIALPSTFVLERIASGDLGCAGWKPARFYQEIEQAFQVERLPHSLDSPATP